MSSFFAPVPTLAAPVIAPSELTVLLLALAVLLGLARLLGETARRLGQPAVLGEIVAGIVLGPTIFGAVSPELFEWLFLPGATAHPTRIALEGIVVLSATLLLMVVGMEVDLSTVWRQGRATLMVSAMGLALPFALGFSLGLWQPAVLSGVGPSGSPLAFALFVGIAMSITALPVIAKIMMDLNLAKSDMGALVISSAMLNDLVGWIGFAVVLALMPVAGAAAADAPSVPVTITLTLLFLVAMLTAGRWLLNRALPYVQAHSSWPGGVLGFVFVVALVCAALTESLGVHSIFGAFIAGVAIGDSVHLTHRTRETINQFVTNFFAPIFFASIGLRVNFIDDFAWQTVVVVFIVALTAKVVGCYSGARFARMGKRESWAVGFGMASQGTVGLILGQLALTAGLITNELMVAIVILALGTSLLAGPAMQNILRAPTKRRLIDLLSDRHIIINLEATDAESAIGEMTKRAAQITGLDAELLNNAVLERERVMATGLPNGLAVPHARVSALNKPCVILGRSTNGIPFDAPDSQPARLVFLLLTPLQQPESQIELLNTVSQTFAHESVRSEVLAAKGSTELLAVLNRAANQQAEAG
jgi:Kef-type K+ transport system membrane component KefB/mannitol/fructose-specific phosphotransferase system IIA component (Ntr-type)